jgi:cell division protein FtsI/penicillin-binding protein 2
VISLSEKAVVLNTLEGLTISAAVGRHYIVNKAAVRYVTKYEDKLGKRVKTEWSAGISVNPKHFVTLRDVQPVVHSNAHKVIAGFFLSPDPEVT